jgi:hypothetical protein
MQANESTEPRYEPPVLILLGPVEELTLGGDPSEPGDGSATYFGGGSDARLKREIRRMPDALSRLRRIGGR